MRDEILNSLIITEEIKTFITEPIQYISEQLEAFCTLARKMPHLKAPTHLQFQLQLPASTYPSDDFAHCL